MDIMPPWRILLVSLLAGVWGVSGGPPGLASQSSSSPPTQHSNNNGKQILSSRSSISFPYDEYSQYSELGSSYYGGSPVSPPVSYSGGSSYSSPGFGAGPSRHYIFPQDDIVMGSSASHSPVFYYPDSPKGPSHSEYPSGLRSSPYGSPKSIFLRDTYKQSSNYDGLPPNYGLHPSVASNINRLRVSSSKPILYSQLRDRERSRYHSASPPGYLLSSPYKKVHWAKYPVKEIPNPDVINNGLISSPFKSKYYKQKNIFSVGPDDPESVYEEPTVKRPLYKKKPVIAQLQNDPDFEIQPSIELGLDGEVVSNRKPLKSVYDALDAATYGGEYYKPSYTQQEYEKPYKTSYDSDREYLKQAVKKSKLKRPSSYDDNYKYQESYDGRRFPENLDSTYKDQTESDYYYHQQSQSDDEYNGPINPFQDDSDSKKYGATSYVSISRPRGVIGFKTLRERESTITSAEALNVAPKSDDSEEQPLSPPIESPILSYKPASNSISNWTPINPPNGGTVPAKSYNIPAPNLATNQRAGTVTDDTVENYESEMSFMKDSQPIMGKPYKSSESNINKSDNSEGVVSAVMFFKQ